MNKSRHLPLTSDDELELKRLLGNVPTETIVQIQWKTPEGHAFVKATRKLQLAGVPLPEIAERLGVNLSTLQGGVRHWERPRPKAQTKGVRQRRPLSRTGE